MTGYYDIILGLIPVSLAGISAVLVATGLGITTAVPLASLVAVGLIGHAMFVNAPVDAPAGQQSSNATSATDAAPFSAD
ncbi:MAG: hypothetical protein ABEJ31_15670 [Haloarculaceae archaeon]